MVLGPGSCPTGVLTRGGGGGAGLVSHAVCNGLDLSERISPVDYMWA